MKNLINQQVKSSFQKSLLIADFAMKYVMQLANHVLPWALLASTLANHMYGTNFLPCNVYDLQPVLYTPQFCLSYNVFTSGDNVVKWKNNGKQP